MADDPDFIEALHELDDLLDSNNRELEGRFQDLEGRADVDDLKRRARSSGGSHQSTSRRSKPRSEPKTDDPLADMKAAVDGKPVERYVLVLCTHCDGKNRVSLTKLRGGDPRCGRCKKDLGFTKS